MFLSWIIKSIPRSLRSFLVLLVIIGSLALMFSGFQDMFAPMSEINKTQVMLKFIIGLLICLPAIGVFYWFQTLDDRKRHAKHDMETLDRYLESDSQARVYKNSTVTPSFTGDSGSIGNPNNDVTTSTQP